MLQVRSPLPPELGQRIAFGDMPVQHAQGQANVWSADIMDREPA
jgi:hypothetical protein